MVLDAIPGEKAAHICFGNYGGQTIQQGTWRALVAFMNRLRADHLVLEFAHRGYEELEYLRELDPRLGIGLFVLSRRELVQIHPRAERGAGAAEHDNAQGAVALEPLEARVEAP